MLIAELGYNAWKSATPEQRQVMIENWPTLEKKYEYNKRNYAEKPEEDWYMEITAQRITMEEAHNLSKAGIDVRLEGVDGTMLSKLQDKPKVDKYGAVHPIDLYNGSTVQIVVPDIGVLQIDEVDWMEDACTQALQDRLDEGWRILAVCPPNAQRRPDYILGRRKKD